MSDLHPAESALIDLELQERSGAEIASAYKALCAAVLLRTANIIDRPCHARKTELGFKRCAQKWLDGGTGIVTFENCCEALGYDPQWAKKRILHYAQVGRYAAINNRKNPPTVFGAINAYAWRKAQAAGRVEPGDSTYPEIRCGTGWTRQGGSGDQGVGVSGGEDRSAGGR